MKTTEARGERIAGSRYYRDFCADCEEPIRVPYQRIGKANRCELCREAGRSEPKQREAKR